MVTSRVPSAVLTLLPLVVAVTAWEATAAAHWIDATLFPPPSAIFAELRRNDFEVGIGFEQVSIVQTVGASLLRVVLGIISAFGCAMVLGSAIAAFAPVRTAFEPLMRLLAPIAPVAWVPLGLALFGVGNSAAIFLVFLGVVFLLTLGIAEAIRSVPREYLQIAKTMGASQGRMWRLVVLPYVLPRAFLLLRFNFFGGWMAVLAAEMVGLRSGLGALIMVGRESANMTLVLFGMFLIGLTGAMFDGLLGWIQHRFLWWGTNEPWR